MAGDAGFDTVLPVLVHRLITETGRDVTELDTPGGSATAVGRLDGAVTPPRGFG
ncbi:hypothetical protein [Saccharothrix australiensis]|uniref:Uncharacterized protein n=1 Tax=Saccharothrix australiensis TaxID=2072 RepID=A0A495W4J2_9PSEU|nr:hypothetical protein [Saccharothrix australiensis]RKT55583.1 hypothetical protein C8E97_4260 [Saccharothrix australiensis]